MRQARSELQELVDSPNETLHAEYKSWLELDKPEARADLARHIAALSNHGGGFIVFGFTDEPHAYAGTNPFSKVLYTRDLVASIAKKYLEPTVQCDVHILKSDIGNEHPVIVVPPHGAVPICAKVGGPVVDGKQKGITQGTYYTRKTGPESAPILTEAEWVPIIRRCVMHDRSALLSTIDAALRRGPASVSVVDNLRVWHDAAHAVFVLDASRGKGPSALGLGHFQFSYAIERSNAQRLPTGELIEILRQVNAEVRDLVATSWSMFHIFTRSGIDPQFVEDSASGQGENDFVECAHLRDPEPRFGAADMWRVSADGMATIIRDYLEDREGLNRSLNRNPGTWLSPNWQIRALAEIVRHARGMAERFEAATTVSFRCEWYGLAGRKLYDPEANWLDHRKGREGGSSEHRVVSGTWPVGTLSSGWDEVVVQLFAPVMRIFAPDFVITASWVRSEVERMTKAYVNQFGRGGTFIITR